ncbi:WAT1-related protein At4g08300-like [Amaranthus tricolor]|uniref:WAT1-related protein At4g08300-like n=1 Tax=Amaranthus tricolor TaxID=29722 RepID=UPI00258463EB|nr:WAT1-related protein At4g08300-like [Amaranthus tricolor]
MARNMNITKFKPHIIMIISQIGWTLLYFITEASFNHGMNPYVYITYRHIVAGVVMLPFAYFLERQLRPKLTVALLAEIFVLSLFGVGLALNMYFASLKYTSPTFVASMINTIASLTFVIAVALKMEVLDIWNPRGLAKVLGTIISLGGVMAMTLYKGSVIRNIWNPLLRIHGSSSTTNENWMIGSILNAASCISWSIWYIMQAYTLKRYPAQLSLTTWMSFVGAAQSAIFTACVQRKPAAWAIGFNIDLLSTIYAGVVCSGLLVFLQLKCTAEKGPVFVTMFNPLTTILVALLAYFVLGEKLYMGSVMGAGIVIFGMYLLMWGKEEAQTNSAGRYLSYKDSTGLKPETDGDQMTTEP